MAQITLAILLIVYAIMAFGVLIIPKTTLPTGKLPSAPRRGGDLCPCAPPLHQQSVAFLMAEHGLDLEDAQSWQEEMQSKYHRRIAIHQRGEA